MRAEAQLQALVLQKASVDAMTADKFVKYLRWWLSQLQKLYEPQLPLLLAVWRTAAYRDRSYKQAAGRMDRLDIREAELSR